MKTKNHLQKCVQTNTVVWMQHFALHTACNKPKLEL